VRTQPLGSWQQGLKVLDLGCGTGQLGIALALAGAAVTLTDLDYIVGLTRTNVDLNAARCAIKPVVQPYLWGAPVSGVRQAGGGQQPDGEQQPDGVQQPEQQAEQQQHSKQQHWDAIVAADVLYEPQYYDALLAALLQLCPVVSPCQPEAAAAVDTSIQQQQQQQPSPPVFICFRVRKYRESTFEAKAAAAGFDVAEVAVSELHGDYRCGGYRLITLRRVREASTAKQSQEGQQRERT
jgi:SAM-dependent methyltransferase